MSNDLVIDGESPAALMRRATDVAGVSKEIVMKTAMTIQGRRYVRVEGWQAIAIAHGCTLTIRSVQAIEGGISAICDVIRIADGHAIASAEGFVGEDEKTWANRPLYAKRAMAQTRAMSRAARSAFAHVVVLIDSNLSTTPAEEVPDAGFDPAPPPPARSDRRPLLERLNDRITEANGDVVAIAEIRREWDANKSKMKPESWERGVAMIDHAVSSAGVDTETGEILDAEIIPEQPEITMGGALGKQTPLEVLNQAHPLQIGDDVPQWFWELSGPEKNSYLPANSRTATVNGVRKVVAK